MDDLSLPDRAEAFYRGAIAAASGRPALAGLERLLRDEQAHVGGPMRVALVGRIKAGKSTLINALLGESLVATGVLELTFNVNCLRWGERPHLLVHFKDGRPPEGRSLGELERLTRRREEHRDFLIQIRMIEVFYPNPILRRFTLVDTPGLASHYQEDSRNSLEFLGMTPAEVERSTEAEVGRADAVLYLFSKTLGGSDATLMEDFHGPAARRATPINAIAVLTKIDSYGSSGREPVEAGRVIAARLQADHPQVRRLFYAVMPVAGQLAHGAQTLEAGEFATLRRLAGLPVERLADLLADVGAFVEEAGDDLPASEARRAVLGRLGRHGVDVAIRAIRGGAADRGPLAAAVLARSGLPELRSLLVSHFGNRALMIKLATSLERIRHACFQLPPRLEGPDRQVVDQLGGDLERLQAHPSFAELAVLRAYYEGRLGFTPEEVGQLLAVTGERGVSPGARLGLEAGEHAEPGEMAKAAGALADAWQLRAEDRFCADSRTVEAARTMADAYRRLRHRV